MLRADDAADAVRLARRIVLYLTTGHGRLGVRIGMHTGPAVHRDGDWFGATVNIASRVTDQALAGDVLMTAATKRAAALVLEGLDVRPRGVHRLKHVPEAVELFQLVVTQDRTSAGRPLDPVCRMALDADRALPTLEHRGVSYHFCSERCQARFRSDPTRYLDSHTIPTRPLLDAGERLIKRLRRGVTRGAPRR